MPTIPEALSLARQHHQAGNLQQAETIYRQILQADPNHADALHLLGLVAQQTGQSDVAIQLITRSIGLDPTNPGFHNNLGAIFLGRQQYAEAAVHCRRAVQLKPDYAHAQYNLANALQLQGNWVEAVTHYREAVHLKPDYAEAHNNLGNIFHDQRQWSEAAAHYEEAIRIRPDFADVHNNLGNVLQDQGELAEAMTHYQEAVRIQPDHHVAHTSLLFCMNHDPDATAEQIFAEHRRWEVLHATARAGQGDKETGRQGDKETQSDASYSLSPCLPVSLSAPNHHLRIGYVSPDLFDHPVARFIEPVLAAHDRSRFQVFCYANAACADEVTRRLQEHVDVWRCVADWSDEQVAQRIRDDEVDILIDLAGHTAHNRLRVFARNPAPVQVTYLGYPNTTGLTAIDYRLTDAIADPPGETTPCTEELVYLPGCFCCYAPALDAPEVSTLPASRTGQVTFGSLHRLIKLNPGVFDVWCQVLRALPNSRLLLSYHTLVGKARDQVYRQFTERGIAGDRLDLHQAVTEEKRYRELYQEIDVMLDAFPWSGHASTCESLWMGVPVVTLKGARHAGRMASSILKAVGLDEWITATPAAYVAWAVKLTDDLNGLAKLRAGLREQMRSSPLCDGPAFTRKLENAYREMWQHCCDTSGCDNSK